MLKKLNHIKAFLCLVAAYVLTSFNTSVAQTPVGEVIENIASYDYLIEGAPFEGSTNIAEFTVQDIPNDPTIEFFRHTVGAPSPITRQINGSGYSPSGDHTGPFLPTDPAVDGANVLIDLSGPIELSPAEAYLIGETSFVQVIDERGNKDPNAIDSIAVEIESQTGDNIVLELFETGPDTNEFWAYVKLTGAEPVNNDIRLSTQANDRLVASYNNGFIEGEVIADTALIDPFGVVFDSVTGEVIDGAIVSMFVSGTDQPASVFGIDGFSTYPSSLETGSLVTDSSGREYQLEPGQFRFPLQPPGQYYIDVEAPEGYNFSSESNAANLQSVGQFVIIPASFGEVFNLQGPEPLNFDIPLDPDSELVLTKTAEITEGDVGDFIPYTLSIANIGNRASTIDLVDTLPVGFRYVEGSAKIAGQAITPTISENGTELNFRPPTGVTGGGDLTLTYTLEIGPGAQLGDAVNRAYARGRDGGRVSNVARAEVRLREDLLRSTSTIIGRVTELSCDEDEEWAREIEHGQSVEGVRLYMETGAYAVTDGYGLYHFEGIDEGTHVVQIDEETLPEGYEPMVCEENSRYAGSATSKFVEISGGNIWRANFYLKKTGADREVEIFSEYTSATAYKDFDREWLNTQTNQISWAYPNVAVSPAIPSLNFGIKHGPDHVVQAFVNDKLVDGAHVSGRDFSQDRKTVLTRFRGVDMLEGDNEFKIVVKDANGNVVHTLTESVAFVNDVERAIGDEASSRLIADGRTAPEIAIRIQDGAGRDVHPGRIIDVDILPPYRLYSETGDDALIEAADSQLKSFQARDYVEVGAHGLAHVRLEPTLKTGKVTAVVRLDNGRQVPIHMYLAPEKRDWILVGLAEATAGYKDVTGNAVAFEGEEGSEFTDGRVAFFAKGMVKGEWLMTLAVDTDKRRGNRDGDFISEIDPNAYYTLYGDRSYAEFEAQSRYPIYVKLEKREAYALFGDFDTNITEGRLTAYNRRMSGLKAEYIGENIQVLGFGAETNQGFAKDEIAADGTSGIYQLSNDRILAQSERIIVETRDRFRPDIVLDARPMVRYQDYTLDYLTGELLFRMPVDVSDAEFNPNVIIVDYETSEDVERNITFGGRAQVQAFNDVVTLGSTFVTENGGSEGPNSKSTQLGVDAVIKAGPGTEFRAEAAFTDNNTIGADSKANALLAEIVHTGDKVSADAYFRQEDKGFGLGQRNSNTNAVRRFGARARLQISDADQAGDERSYERYVEGQAAREENLDTGAHRTSADIRAEHIDDGWRVGAGLRSVRDLLADGTDRESLLALANASKTFLKTGLTFQISHEQPLGGKDSALSYPQRTILGIDKTFGGKITVSGRHELLNGPDQESQNSSISVSASPWKGANLTAASDLLTQDSNRRLGATLGLDQQIQLNSKWSASAGLRNRRIIESAQGLMEITPDAVISPIEGNDEFFSGYLGLGYRTDVTTGSVRVEGRSTSNGQDTYILSAGVARELSEEVSIAGASRHVLDFNDTGSDRELSDVRLGIAYRPRDEDIVILDRLDISHNNIQGVSQSMKVVNNFAINSQINDRWQASGHYGVKYVSTEIDSQTLDSWTHLLGGETRFDITKRIDLGFNAQALGNENFSEVSYSYGPSIGFTPAKNIWASVGYNFDGFSDDDFEAAEFSRKGVYLKLRVKFDQNTARGLLRRISPSSYR